MWNNYFKIAFRNLWRNKIFSLLNILGLSLGITSALLLYFFIHFELSMDNFHSKKDRIFRLTEEIEWQDNYLHFGMNSGLLAPQLKKDFPEVKAFTRLQFTGNELFHYKNKKLYIDNTVYVDSTFFDVFSFELKEGDKQTCITEPNSVILTEETAQKIFGTSEGVIGNTIKINNKFNVKVTAIAQNPPKNSSLEFNALFSMSTPLDGFIIDDWGSFGNLFSFVLLKEGQDARKLAAKATPHIKNILMKESWDTQRPEEVKYTLHLQAVTEMHLYSGDIMMGGGGDINQVYILIFITIFILVIASINYINLSTARAVHRAKEVGVRKVLGSHKKQLILQFMVESFIIVNFAFILSLAAAEMLNPLFEQLLNKTIGFSYFENPSFFLIIILTILSLTFLSGLYPAFVLSSFRPVQVLKGKFTHNIQATFLRKGLVIFQFAISMVFIISTWLFYTQLNFMKAKDLGLDKSKIVSISVGNPDFDNKKINEIKKALGKNANISLLSSASNNIGQYSVSQSTIRTNMNDEEVNLQIQHFAVDANFQKIFDIELKSGRFFSEKYATDSAKYVVINETLAKKIGGVDAAIGKKVEYHNREEPYEVVGVVKDFHLLSLKEPIKPLLMFLEKERMYQIYAKVNPKANPQEVMKELQKIYEKFDKTYPFTADFVEQNYLEHYVRQERQSKVFLIFTGLAIFIACLGLFGLASYTVQQKTKEIGIRKVLGASIQNILFIVSKDFMLLIGIASIIALPLAFYFMSNFLNDFAYKIGLLANWYIFLIAIFVALFIAGVTILTQALRATRVNPIEVLKDE